MDRPTVKSENELPLSSPAPRTSAPITSTNAAQDQLVGGQVPNPRNSDLHVFSMIWCFQIPGLHFPPSACHFPLAVDATPHSRGCA